MIKRGCICLTLLWGFLLGSYNGYIALWQGDDPEPVKVFPYQTASVPAADQAALEKGISVDNKSELLRLLEDYLS